MGLYTAICIISKGEDADVNEREKREEGANHRKNNNR